jgi:hypothetical protein
MKITIEFDPDTLRATIMSDTHGETRMVTKAAAETAPSEVLDAGACAGLPADGTTSAALSGAINAGAAPPVHPDTFGVRAGDSPSENGISAGSPLNGART